MEFQNKIRKTPTILHSYGWKTQVSPVVDYDDVELLLSKIQKKKDVAPKELEFDRYQIFIACNVWCLLYGDILGQSPLAIKHFLIGNGLQRAVSESSDHYHWLVSNGKHGHESVFWTSSLQRAFGNSFVQGPSASNVTANVSTLLKCIKRLQLRSIAIDESKAWLKSNKQCEDFRVDSWFSSDDYLAGKSPSFGHPSSRLMTDLREVFEWIVEDWEQDTSLFRLPPGSTAEKWPKCYLDKFKVCVNEQNWLRRHGVNIPVIDIPTQSPTPRVVVKDGKKVTTDVFVGDNHSYIHDYLTHGVPKIASRFLTVPKNLEKGRGVCPEPVSKQVLGYQVSSGLYKCLRSMVHRVVGSSAFSIDTKDQTWNQRLIQNPDYATLDLKAASDSISYRLGQELCARRPDLWEKIKACRSSIVEFKNGHWERNHHLVTMGNSITFNLETIIFCAIVILAISYYIAFSQDDLTQEDIERLIVFAVFGDDIVVANEVAETVIDMLHIFGFEVNLEKSFIRTDSDESFYRESCGVEYRDNLDVTGCYFPRSLGDLPSAELVSLQHKYVNWENTSSFLTQCVLDVLPSTIISQEGCTYDDLWASYPVAPDLAGSSDYGRFFTNFTFTYWVSAQENGYSLKTKGIVYKDIHLSLAHSAERITQRDRLLAFASIMCREEHDSTLENKHILRWSKRETWLRSYRLPEQDDYEYHMIIGSRQNRQLPVGYHDRELLELCMYLLTIGNGLEHMAVDPFLDPKHMVRDRRDLLGDREILWQKKRTLR